MSKIEELKRAYEAATPGKWEELDSYLALLTNENPHRPEIVTEIGSRHEGNSPAYATSPEDATFITLAHNLMPQLLDAMELIGIIARMKTDTEIQEQTGGDDCMSGDDAVETLGNLIESARLGELK